MYLDTNYISIADNVLIDETAKYFHNLPKNEWEIFNLRQQTFNVHRNTKTICALWIENDYSNRKYLNQYKEHKSNFDLLINNTIKHMENYYQEAMFPLRAMVVLLPAQQKILEHADLAQIFNETHRVHTPLINNKDVKFYVEDEIIPMNIGTIVEINNKKNHKVINASNKNRLQFICDVLPKSKKSLLK